MPKIRKKTSNRQSTRDRAKITKKAAEQKKKNRKATKRDQTWKSKKKADPGVPNSFPFKDQVLAQIAEEKRKAEEDKLARKQSAKTPKSEDNEDDAPGVSSLGRTVLSRAPLSVTSSFPVAENDDSEVPQLIDTALPTLQEALDRADVVCEVVDARDILGGRSHYIEGLVKEADGKIVLIVNKVDLVPREALQQWISHLDIPTFLFKSALPALPPIPSSSKSPGHTFFIEPSTILGRDELFSAAKKWSAEKKKSQKGDEPLILSLMGLPSVGKTSILNSLLPQTVDKSRYVVAPIIPTAESAKQPTPTTKAPVEVEIDVDGLKIRIIDTPGWEPFEDDDDEEQGESDEEAQQEELDNLEERLVGDVLRKNLGRVDRVKDVFPLVNYILSRSNHQDIMLAYNIPFFAEGDMQAFLTGLARANQRIRKHGEPDLESAGRLVLRDWALNAFPYYSTLPKASKQSMDVDSSKKAEQYDMTAVLENCKGKKEMKKKSVKGLVRFKGGEIDAREVSDHAQYQTWIAADDHKIVLDDNHIEAELARLSDDDDDLEDEDEDDEADSSEEEPFLIASDEGEVLQLSDGPEPSSGSDLSHDDEESESTVEPQPQVPSPPKPTTGKKRRISDSSNAPAKKTKRVSFAKEVSEREIKPFRGSETRGKGRK
nr:nuclear GTP-binding protein [Cryptococcus depauperatus CBS 7841]